MAGGKKGLMKAGMAFVSQKRKPASSKNDEVDEMMDDTDEFMKGRNKVRLNMDADEYSEEEEDALGFEDLDEDEEEGEEEDEDAEFSRWGKDKRSFYNTDNVEEMISSSEEDEMNEDEEKEALRLQKKQAASLSAEDFDDDAQMFGDRIKKNQNGTAKKPSDTKEKKKSAPVSHDLEPEVETLHKDLSKLTTSQKLDIISRESPELLSFLDEFKQMIEEVKNKLGPILDRVRNGDLPTSKGVSFLEVKYHLLLSYCTQICYYLLLKAQGKSVKEHPVIMQLVRIRTMMEKMKPLDLKLKNQIDKLLKVASVGHLQGDEDPRKFKPRLEDLENPEEEEEEEEEGGKSSGKLYRPPQISAAPFEERGAGAKSKAKLRNEQRMMEKVGRSKLMRDIGQEFSEAPEERPNLGAAPKMKGTREQEITEYEEENMVRLDQGKKKTKKQKERFEDDLNVFDEFEQLSALNRKDDQDSSESRSVLQRKQMKDILADKKKRKTGSDDLEEDEFYKEMQQQQAEKKRRSELPRTTQRAEEEYEDDGEEEEESRRGISRNISSNRGLTKSRNKDKKHSRIKLRGKFEKATSKRGTFSKGVANQSKPYSGESTGIKASAKRSRKLY